MKAIYQFPQIIRRSQEALARWRLLWPRCLPFLAVCLALLGLALLLASMASGLPKSALALAVGNCPLPGTVARDGWQLAYETTNTDGLHVYEVRYHDELVLTSAKLVEWHADYGLNGFLDITGCGGTGGFFIYPYGQTQVVDLLDEAENVVGFELIQDFRMNQWGQDCNYRYEQHFQFWADGRFRVVGGAYGRGCGPTALYRAIIRIDIAAGGDDAHDNFAYWDGQQWLAPEYETYRVPYAEAGHGPHALTADTISWRVVDASGAGYLIEPAVGQFADGGRGDEPFLYVTLHKPEEGDWDLNTIGTCCRDDHRQGPEKFIYGTPNQPQVPEPISNSNVVLWYVPQLPTDGKPGSYYCWTVTGEPNPESYPCFGGPMFHPIPDEPVADFAVWPPVVISQTAVFQNLTTGQQPISYTWDFGDGVTSTLPMPTHVYTQVGEVVVGLTAVNLFGSSSITRTIEVIAPLPAIYLPYVQNE